MAKANGWTASNPALIGQAVAMTFQARRPRGSRAALAMILEMARAELDRRVQDPADRQLPEMIAFAASPILGNLRVQLGERREDVLHRLAAACGPLLAELWDVMQAQLWLASHTAAERLAKELIGE